MKKHLILFLAANPRGGDPRMLGEECSEIQRELKIAPFRDDFQFESRWAVSIDELIRHLNELDPTVIHFSGHGGGSAGLMLQDSQGEPQPVSARALAMIVDTAALSARVVVLNACSTTVQAEALRAKVECVVGMDGAIGDDAARAFAMRFYGALGNRRSIGNAVAQAVAALAAKKLPEEVLPRCLTRDGVDANRLVLEPSPGTPGVAGEPSTLHNALGGEPARTAPQPQPRTAARPRVDIGILTIRDDEFRAVLDVFPGNPGVFKGAHREYALRDADAGGGNRYQLALLRQLEQGNGEAQDAVRDLIDDLTPRLVLVVGIAGAVPSDDVKLGDVVVSTRILDFSVERRQFGEAPEYATAGGAVTKALAAAVVNLAARETELCNWTADLEPQPAVSWHEEGDVYGPEPWQRTLRKKLAHHYGAGAKARGPVYVAGPIASSDRLVKDPELLLPLLVTARNFLAVEMESGGVFRAVRERCAMLAIRGISDIVGLKRADAWTKYACASAAAFTRGFLRTRPIELDAPALVFAPSPSPPGVPAPGGPAPDPR